MSFGEKLYELRTRFGLSQEDLAYKLGVSRQAVSKWELGPALPEMGSIVCISDLFNVSLDYLLKDNHKSDDMERLVVKFISSANNMSDAAKDLIDITSDGVIDDTERPRLDSILEMLESVETLINEMRLKLGIN